MLSPMNTLPKATRVPQISIEEAPGARVVLVVYESSTFTIHESYDLDNIHVLDVQSPQGSPRTHAHREESRMIDGLFAEYSSSRHVGRGFPASLFLVGLIVFLSPPLVA